MKAAIYDRTGVRPLLQNIIYNSKPIQHTVATSCLISSISNATEIDLWLFMSGRGGGKMAMSKVTYNNCSFSLVNDLEIKSTTKNLKMVVPYELPPPAVEKLIFSGDEIRANKNCVKLEQLHSDRLEAKICATAELIVQLSVENNSIYLEGWYRKQLEAYQPTGPAQIARSDPDEV